ncbi:type IX secretion system membrane protein PorP/SprF [Zhouia sp. PK063]|uniref:type IX secretion system membrane protein PorP/SprF n=1 Tax=Zhouia sp. PK063 TaxID=3373602 RepID=UPI0037B25795
MNQKKSTYKVILTVMVLLVSFHVKAQQDPQYTQYMYNMMSVNPAYAGSVGTLEIVGLHRSQWVGFDGAPQTENIGIHSPLRNEKVGLGLNIINDNLGPSNETYFDGNFSYTIKLNYNTQLAFGLKAGGKILNLDWSKGIYKDPDDVVYNQNVKNRFNPLIGAGMFLYADKWYVGFSIPDFINDEYYDDVAEGVNAEQMHYYLTGGYVFDLSYSLKLKPAVFMKYVAGAPLAVDLSANFLINDMITLGASYRFDDSVSGLAGFQLTQSFFVGYAYDYTTTDFNKYNSGTHEIVLRFQLSKKTKKIQSPRFF